MGENGTAVPRLNGYGKLTVGSLVVGVAALLLGDSASLAVWFVGLAVVFLAVAMYRNPADEQDRYHGDDTGSGSERIRAKEAVDEFEL
ncbi:hypothetical protein [Natrialba sp. SSL1]|uniref:hypothetical protein n=1 Tax=Natrialba sp. SSL1 TaxID=1869245 RepID=UPI0008F86E0E|nr:hypothetical protein [Natrialba sp. SSL1]OIB58325.1 hypothetical protein BBD46_08340 [Natrialba sp. SSL1]